MVEFDRTLEREAAPAENLKICVVGIGGGGLNVLDRISLDRMLDATVVAMHTDVRVLTHSMSPAKIQLGADVMRGIGCGGDPELGREAAIASREKIRAVIDGHNMVFICCGLGGGTGSGAAPVVARIAKESGALVFVFATTPFVFEGRRRLIQAESSMAELQNHVDALILFENNRMGELVLPKEGIQKAFSQADQLIGHSVRAIATMVTQPGIVRMGLADLMTALNSPNARCLFGFGEARGANRVSEALKRSLKSPLVNQGELLQNARNLLVHVAGGESLTLAEVESLMKQLGKCVPENTQIMFGLAVDPRMGDAIALTLVSSLSAQEMSRSEIETGSSDNRSKLKSQEVIQQADVNVSTETAASPAPVQAPEPVPMEQAVIQPPVSEEVKVKKVPIRQEPAAVESAPAEAKVDAARKLVESVERDLFGEEIVIPAHGSAEEVQTPANTPPLTSEKPVNEKVASTSATSPTPSGQVRIVIPQVTETAVEEETTKAPVSQETAKIRVRVTEEVASNQQISEPTTAPEVEAESPVEMSSPAAVSTSNAEVTKSIFSVVDSSDDEEEEYSEDELLDDEVDEPEVAPHANGYKPSVTTESDGTHWADKYTQSSPQVAASTKTQAVAGGVSPREPAMAGTVAAKTAVAATSAPAASAAAFKQANFNLNQDEAGRFKGTTKTIVEGEDLDIPTWMRLKKK